VRVGLLHVLDSVVTHMYATCTHITHKPVVCAYRETERERERRERERQERESTWERMVSSLAMVYRNSLRSDWSRHA